MAPSVPPQQQLLATERAPGHRTLPPAAGQSPSLRNLPRAAQTRGMKALSAGQNCTTVTETETKLPRQRSSGAGDLAATLTPARRVPDRLTRRACGNP